MDIKQLTTEPPVGQRGNQKIPEIDENKDTNSHHLWGTAEVVLRGQFITLQAFLRKEERTHIHNFPA